MHNLQSEKHFIHDLLEELIEFDQTEGAFYHF